MTAVDIGVGHDHDSVVAQRVLVEGGPAHPQAEGTDERLQLVVVVDLVVAGLLDVEDLAAQGDGLGLAISALLALPAALSPSTT